MRVMNDSPLEIELNNSLFCIEPCSDSDYLLTLMLSALIIGYFIWEWNHG